MSKLARVTQVAVFFILLSCSEPLEYGSKMDSVQNLSISQLSKPPDLYDSIVVELTGYYYWGFEQSVFYERKWIKSNSNAVWVDFTDSLNDSVPEGINDKLQGERLKLL